MIARVVVFSSMVVVALATSRYSFDAPSRPSQSYIPPSRSTTAPPTPTSSSSPDSPSEDPAQYDSQYTVRDEESGNNFGHQETRDGDVIEGTYYVQLADGRMQIVNYYVTPEDGYVAEVTYEGEATEAPEES